MHHLLLVSGTNSIHFFGLANAWLSFSNVYAFCKNCCYNANLFFCIHLVLRY
jgi:hypothetical protein